MFVSFQPLFLKWLKYGKGEGSRGKLQIAWYKFTSINACKQIVINIFVDVVHHRSNSLIIYVSSISFSQKLAEKTQTST